MIKQTQWGGLQTLKKTYKRGTELIIQGNKPKALYVLVSGRLSVFRNGIPVSQIKKSGEYIGEIPALLIIPASTTVKAETEIVVIEIESIKIVPFFFNTPKMAVALAKRMAERLAELNSNFTKLIDKSYRPDLVKVLQQKQQISEMQNAEELNLQKLKSFFVEIAEGRNILTQGQYPDALYILVKGSLDIIKNRKAIAVEDKLGYYLGDAAILSNSFSNVTVVTRTASTLVEVKKDKLDSFLNHSPEIVISIMVKLAERTHAINELFLDLQVDAVTEIIKKSEQIKNDEQLKKDKEIKNDEQLKKDLQLKKDEIRKEINERKKNRDEQNRLEILQKEKVESVEIYQDSIITQIAEFDKVAKEIYKLLGIEIDD